MEFGTSFATPRVTAEIINFSNEHFTPLILDNPNAIDPNQVVTEEEITTYTDWFVKNISTEMDVLFEEFNDYVGL